jgi:hypothetical protein
MSVDLINRRRHHRFDEIWGALDSSSPAPFPGLCSCLRCGELAVFRRSGLFAELLAPDVHLRGALVAALGDLVFYTVNLGTRARGEHACTR